MELALSLGNRRVESTGICMGVGMKKKGSSPPSKSSASASDQDHDDDHSMNMMIKINQQDHQEMRREKVGSSDPSPSLRLHLHPHSPVPLRTQTPPLRFPWLSDNLSSEPGSSDGPGSRIVDVNRRGGAAEEVEEQSSPNSGTSSFMEFSLYPSTCNGGRGRRENGENNNYNYGQEGMGVGVVERGTAATTTTTTSRGSDDDENGSSTRKKLRLSKEQSAFLEESFKEHHTLNPKQKLELAKQLNLRPRQVEVWFQNRRARTKLKQTEVDCEYLKRCCETLTEENRRLQKELQELRALKTSQPFFMHLPATTLTMCPSCERVAPASTSSASATVPTKPAVDSGVGLSLVKPKPKLPFSQGQTNQASS
ncbi:hypothetical protein Cgig2_012176 [Carnegiea gigantea]|uniref:Homeobox domain-containing protein n=1 Tax=Carnegiea gigantea TaxID=171969 RepID=A0A9Q1KTU2_9CARY|nr:hypothetical protein Cgig2_012176 [Carnegiea gigantea]